MNTGNISISVGPAVVRITPYGFHMYARRYLDVANTVDVGPEFSPVPYYLYCRALELVMKAYLLARGRSEKQVARLGHDLVKIVRKARSLGLDELVSISNNELAEIEKANDYYKGKGFEYFKVGKAARGYPDLPDLRVLKSCVSRVVDKLRSVCLDAA